ncbi:HU family DNA-binding protein [Mesomycoplasma lagogenitalium]|uniref:HU family DNA-binding protein n=1 Tax=Mesomycoplasma lagogenitalium TaxID=171286 RepID=A0ABY8LT69_9BACT|nr:HU family DNA-binding protein [Mesomycoplasma lagogenitalium]WGI36442.1 HU family DNA-binding protein [Mesomycoplasma lagogenitalium]
MKKKELLQKIVAKTNLNMKDADAFLNAFVDVVIAEVAENGEVGISGFGSFYSIVKKERETTHWETNEKFVIPSKKSPKFKPAKNFKDIVSGEKEE